MTLCLGAAGGENVMNTSNRNNVIGIGVLAVLIAIALYFYLGPATVGSVPEPVATGQTK
jgi:hypothetical protein